MEHKKYDDPFIAEVQKMYLEQAVDSLLPLALRYMWLRSHLEFINFEGGEVSGHGHSGALTCDTSDVGLDHAIDRRLPKQTTLDLPVL
jgi:hypothetical protein